MFVSTLDGLVSQTRGNPVNELGAMSGRQGMETLVVESGSCWRVCKKVNQYHCKTKNRGKKTKPGAVGQPRKDNLSLFLGVASAFEYARPWLGQWER